MGSPLWELKNNPFLTESQPIQSHLSNRRRNASLKDVMEKGSLMWCLWRPQQARGHSKKSRPIYRRESWAGKKIAKLLMQSLIPAAILWDKSWSMTFSFVGASCNWAPFTGVRTDSPTHTMLWDAQLSFRCSWPSSTLASWFWHVHGKNAFDFIVKYIAFMWLSG